MAIKKFIVGKWYKWVGPKVTEEPWTCSMVFFFDGKPHKCIKTDRTPSHANFDNDPYSMLWIWWTKHTSQHKYFVLCRAPAKKKVRKP